MASFARYTGAVLLAFFLICEPLFAGDKPSPSEASQNGDADGDGLSDDQEAIFRTNPNIADTDEDGVLDGQDGWPQEQKLSPKRLPSLDYAVIDLGKGIGIKVNNLGQVLFKDENDVPKFRDANGSISLIQPPSNVPDRQFWVGDMNNLGTVVGFYHQLNSHSDAIDVDDEVEFWGWGGGGPPYDRVGFSWKKGQPALSFQKSGSQFNFDDGSIDYLDLFHRPVAINDLGLAVGSCDQSSETIFEDGNTGRYFAAWDGLECYFAAEWSSSRGVFYGW